MFLSTSVFLDNFSFFEKKIVFQQARQIVLRYHYIYESKKKVSRALVELEVKIDFLFWSELSKEIFLPNFLELILKVRAKHFGRNFLYLIFKVSLLG